MEGREEKREGEGGRTRERERDGGREGGERGRKGRRREREREALLLFSNLLLVQRSNPKTAETSNQYKRVIVLISDPFLIQIFLTCSENQS